MDWNKIPSKAITKMNWQNKYLYCSFIFILFRNKNYPLKSKNYTSKTETVSSTENRWLVFHVWHNFQYILMILLDIQQPSPMAIVLQPQQLKATESHQIRHCYLAETEEELSQFGIPTAQDHCVTIQSAKNRRVIAFSAVRGIPNFLIPSECNQMNKNSNLWNKVQRTCLPSGCPYFSKFSREIGSVRAW